VISLSFVLRNLINLLFRRGIRFEFDRIPLRTPPLSPRKTLNLFRVGLNRLLPLTKARGNPYMAHISPAGLCNLSCELCPVHDPEMKGKELLPFATFKKFIDEAGADLLYLILWSWGEPLLNPDLVRMTEYARRKKILTVTSSNLNRLRRDEARALAAAGPDALIIALDGVTEETYGRQRKGGRASDVVANTRLLLDERARAGSKIPFLNLRMVVSKENEHEVEAFRTLAKDLGVDMVSWKAFSTRQPGYGDPDFDKRFAPEDERFRWYRYLPGYVADRRVKRYDCKFPWTKPTLFPDGEVLACEFDMRYEHSFGNIRQQSFRDIWFGPRAAAFRRTFRADRDDIRYCRDCVYDHKLFSGCVVAWEILKK
jgi:radical SAM protein with 4Fe4S-binding SPASM domain